MSGVLYPMLILILFLTVQTLVMMSNRKEILDKNKEKLLESVNAANQVYTNEELSILLGELEERQTQLENDMIYYEPKDLTEVYSPSELKAKVEKGDFSGLHIGDYFKVKLPDISPFDTNICPSDYQSTNYIQIAGFDSYMGYGETAITKRHIVFVFKNIIALCKYNATDTNEGGYQSSELKKQVDKLMSINSTKSGKTNENWYTYSIEHRRLQAKGIQSGTWTFDNARLFLLQEVEVSGSMHWGNGYGNLHLFQLPLFAYYGNVATIKYYNTSEFTSDSNSRNNWWLESPSIVNTKNFVCVASFGSVGNNAATMQFGLVPAFLFG